MNGESEMVCLAALERWYHRSGKCKPFLYGGCGGNANNFRSKELCEKFCLEKAGNKTPIDDSDLYN